MTHRHYRFWRDAETNKVYSHTYCGEDVPIPITRHMEDLLFRENLHRSMRSAERAFDTAGEDTISSNLVMDIKTGQTSMCEECEAEFGLAVLAEVGETGYITLNEVSRGGWRK